MAAACACRFGRTSAARAPAAPLASLRGGVSGARIAAARRGLATEAGEATHWSKDKAKTNAIKQYGTYATLGVFGAGFGWRAYQWATGSLPGQEAAAPAAAPPTEEALAAETKKSVVHWEGAERPPVERGEPAAAAVADDEHEPDPPEGSAKAMKLAHDLQLISNRLARAEKALGCPEQKTVTHVVLLKLKEEATAEQKAAIVSGLRALPSQIPEIAAYRCGPDLGLDPSGQDLAIVGEFASVADYQTYAKHPAHTGLIASAIKPLLVARTAAQFEHGESETYETGTKCGVTHVVILKLADPAAAPGIIEALRTLPEKVGQIQEFRCGADLGIDPSGASLALVGSMKCKGCYGGYAKNADHQAVIADHIKPALAAAGGRTAAQFNIEL